jgi:hypothetical protein
MKTTNITLPGSSVLSLTLRGDCAECHIWTGPNFDRSDVLTGAGFYSVMIAVKSAVLDSGANRVLIVACDDRRQRIFDRYAKKCGGTQVAAIDPDGDPCNVWAF